jgi:hypothetical protein
MRIIDHPYTELAGGQWLRGNLHTHTDRSDGERSIQEAIDDHSARGHGFLMISDHDVYTSAEALADCNPRGMVLIPGNEITANGPHLLHVNADRMLEPHKQRQRVLNEARSSRGFIIVCHADWSTNFNHCSIGQMTEWIGYIGMEVYNGIIGRLDGSPCAANKWDVLLSQGRRIWAFANDDSHRAKGDSGLGWNVAYVKERTPEGVADALANGRFYASTGVNITSIQVDELRIRIETANADRIVALQQVAKRFAVVDGNAIEVSVPPDAAYVRFECYGRREQLAWTQPFFIVGE